MDAPVCRPARPEEMDEVYLEVAGKSRIFLFSDIEPAFYERLGFRALAARFQRKPGSCCMVQTDDLGALVREPGFEPPEYF